MIEALNKFNFTLKNVENKEVNMELIPKIYGGEYFNRVPKLHMHDGCQKVIAVVQIILVSRLENY